LHVILVSFFVVTVFFDRRISPVFIYAIADAALLMFGYLAFFHDAPHSTLIESSSGYVVNLIILFPIATDGALFG